MLVSSTQTLEGALTAPCRTGGTITAGQLVQQIRLVASQKAFAGLILRVDSPGGDALASDLIWRELRVLAEKKPVIASMGDVAASGGAHFAPCSRYSVTQCPRFLTGHLLHLANLGAASVGSMSMALNGNIEVVHAI